MPQATIQGGGPQAPHSRAELKALAANSSELGAQVGALTAELQAAAIQGAGQRAPQSRAELQALIDQRSELKDQVRALAERRFQLTSQGPAPGTSLTAFQGQLAEIDSRATNLNAQIAFLDDRIATGIGRGLLTGAPDQSAAASLLTKLAQAPSAPTFDARLVVGTLAGEALLFVLLGAALWRFGWRRFQAQTSRFLADNSRKLDQVQQSIDVIAVEVERISEGQRFVSKLLGEGDREALPIERKDKVGAP